MLYVWANDLKDCEKGQKKKKLIVNCDNEEQQYIAYRTMKESVRYQYVKKITIDQMILYRKKYNYEQVKYKKFIEDDERYM